MKVLVALVLVLGSEVRDGLLGMGSLLHGRGVHGLVGFGPRDVLLRQTCQFGSSKRRKGGPSAIGNALQPMS